MNLLKSEVKASLKHVKNKLKLLYSTIDHIPKGYLATGLHCGTKGWPKKDLTLVKSQVPATTAVVFTQNQFKGAHVLVDKDLLQQNNNMVDCIVANSGIANAATGAVGIQNAKTMSTLAQRETNSTFPAFVMSTGAIGPHMPMDKVNQGIVTAAKQLGSDESDFWDATKAILQADSIPKVRSAKIWLSGLNGAQVAVNFLGFIKGCGMIQPNVATMLCIILTDLSIEQSTWQDMLRDATSTTINHITLDGDMSPNDTVIALANGLAQNNKVDSKSGPDYVKVRDELCQMCKELAQALIRDAGGTDITVLVRRARSAEEANIIGHSIANSTQMKVAIAGGDANWGAVIASAGATSAHIDMTKLSMWLHGGTLEQQDREILQLMKCGEPTVFDTAKERVLLSEPEITFELDLGLVDGVLENSATCWTTHLTVGYLEDNS